MMYRTNREIGEGQWAPAAGNIGSHDSSSFFILESLMSHAGTAYIGKIRRKDITLVLGHLRICFSDLH